MLECILIAGAAFLSVNTDTEQQAIRVSSIQHVESSSGTVWFTFNTSNQYPHKTYLDSVTLEEILEALKNCPKAR